MFLVACSYDQSHKRESMNVVAGNGDFGSLLKKISYIKDMRELLPSCKSFENHMLSGVDKNDFLVSSNSNMLDEKSFTLRNFGAKSMLIVLTHSN